ncbi:MAG TPA: hypothetical protein VFT45_07095, partial [Longimicrobium sp.]|nr:hypothetical protein [Longimicrobium sp.]
LKHGAPAGDDPWDAYSLEWATASPPPSYNFLHIPIVQGLYALWERTPDRPVVVGMNPERREILLTTVLDAEPDARYVHPGGSIAPLLCALAVGVTFIGGIFTPWAFVVGPVLLFPPLLLWMATQEKHHGPPTYAEEPA